MIPKNLTQAQLDRLRKPEKVKKPARDTGPSPEVRAQVHHRAINCCERCGIWAPSPVGEIHHRRNRSQGVDNSLPNLVLLCKPCHGWVGRELSDAHTEGFHLENGERPAETELRYGGPYVQEYGRRPAKLREDGEVTLISESHDEVQW